MGDTPPGIVETDRMRLTHLALLMPAVVIVAACGLNIESADLFLLTRTGEGTKLTMLVNDSGTIRCNGGPVKTLSDPLLLQARDLATSLDNDATAKLHIPSPPESVFSYKVTLENGTITFPDTAGARHSELAQTEQFVLAAAPACGISQ